MNALDFLNSKVVKDFAEGKLPAIVIDEMSLLKLGAYVGGSGIVVILFYFAIKNVFGGN